MPKLLNFLLGSLVATSLLVPAVSQARTDLPQFADLVELAGPAVVNIRTTAAAKNRASRGRVPIPEGMDENDPFFEFFRRFFPPGQEGAPGRRGAPPGNGSPGGDRQVPRGVGSGFVISPDGFVMTNHHVVNGADEIFVTFSNDREYKAKLVGSDQRTDVAVVKLEATDLPSLTIGDPEKVRVGEWVLAIGSPFGLQNTVTAGIVSAKGRDTGDYLPFIQTDVAVNPGNSGGPLINMNGEVIGINSQIYSRTGGFMGISFAIPIDEAMNVADQLRSAGRVVRGRIGVGIAEVTKEIAEPLGLPNANGALVRSVAESGPAEAGGVEIGDIITKFNGREIAKASDLPRIVGGTKPGTKVEMEVWRKGDTKTLNLTVGEMKADGASTPAAPAPEPEKEERSDASSNSLGLGVVNLPAEKAKELRIKGGVLVDAVEGPAQEAGLRKGDVVLTINNVDVDSVPKFNAVSAKLESGKTAVLLVQRGESAQYVPIKPGR
ncbi:MAG: Do family serine endopeptidase [Burkholderiaceae bacterium]